MEPASHEICIKTSMAQLPDTPSDAITRVLSPRGGSSDTRSRQSTHDTFFPGLLPSLAPVPPSVRVIKNYVFTTPLGPGINQHRRAHSDSGLLLLSSRHEKSHYRSYGESFSTIPPFATRLSLGDMESGRIAKNEKPPVQIAQRYLHPLIMLLTFLLILFLYQCTGIHVHSDGLRVCKWTEGCFVD
jgi:hypothetical protein